MPSRIERAIRADLEDRRAALAAERDAAAAHSQRLATRAVFLSGALDEIDRLLSGFDGGDDEEGADGATTAAAGGAGSGDGAALRA